MHLFCVCSMPECYDSDMIFYFCILYTHSILNNYSCQFQPTNNVVTGLGSHCILGFTDSRGSHFIQGGVTVC